MHWIIKIFIATFFTFAGLLPLKAQLISTQQDVAEQRNFVRSDLLNQVNQLWHVDKPEKIKLGQADTPQNADKKQSYLGKINQITLPKINFNELPLSQALKILSELTEMYDAEGKGINFVLVDPQHRNPIVDLNVKNMALDKIIHFLAQTTGLNLRFESDAVIFQNECDIEQQMETKSFAIARGVVLQILQYSAKSSEDVHAEELNLKKFFEKIGILFQEPHTGFAYDGTRLIISHTLKNLDKISQILSFYQNTYQVSIEAKFLEVQQGVLEELGVKWNFGKDNRAHVQTEETLRSMKNLQTALTANAESSTPPSFPNILNLGPKSSFLNAATVLNGYQMGCIMQALEQKTGTDLMSAPKITVLSGRKAEIIVAQEFRYPESYRDTHAEVGGTGRDAPSAGTALMAGTPEKFVTRNVGVEMSVTPIVESNYRINLALEPCVTEFEGFVEYGGNNVVTYGTNKHVLNAGYYQPIFSKRQIKTEVTIQNGSTVVMGGLTREEVKEVRDRVPLLGDIPLLGKIFSSQGHSTQKRNLLIFVTANLLDADGRMLQIPENI
ncbi:MAG: type II and III secretion system protein [Puniceicoccales bacterium]|jgi:general secretion pathway protein D|nr:type II and III secretion system protein [Puniceicoccales bacterium]